MSTRKSSVVLELQNKIGGPLRRIRRQVRAATADVRRSFANVGRAGRTLALGIGTAAAGISAALAKITFDTASRGDEIAKLADQIGISTDALQEWRFAAERQGVAQGHLGAALSTFSKRLGEAKNGTGALASYLKKANPELLKQLVATENLEQAFGLYMRAIAATSDETVKAAGASAAFSKTNADLIRIVRDGWSNVEQLKQQAHELGLVLSEDTARSAETFQDSLTNVQSAIQGVKTIMGAELMPAVRAIMDEITKLVVENAGAIRAWSKEFASELPGRFKTFREGVVQTIKQVKAFVDFIGGWQNALIGVGLVITGPLLTSTLGLAAALVTLGAKLKIAAGVQWLFNAALAANPIGLVVTAIAGLVALLASLGVGFDDVTRVINDAVSYWKKAFSGWVDAFRQSWDTAVEYVAQKVQAIKGLVPDWMRNTIGGSINVVKDAGSKAVGVAKQSAARVAGIFGYGGDEGARAAPVKPISRPPPPASNGATRQEIGVGGTLEIRFDNRGRPQVRSVEQRGPMDIDVDAGPLVLRGG